MKEECTMGVSKRHEKKTSGAGVVAATAAVSKPTRVKKAWVEQVYDDLEESVRVVASTKRLHSVKRGLGAEHVHAKTFTANAIGQGRADLAAEVHTPGDRQVDVRITKSCRMVSAVQLKYSDSAQESGLRLARPKYDGVEQLVVPAGQKEAALDTLRKCAERNVRSCVERKRDQGGVQRRAAARLDDRIRYEGVASDPLSVTDADALAAGDAGFVRKARKQATRRARKEVGFAGAAVGGVVSAAVHAARVSKGEESLVAAVKEVLKDAATSALKSILLAEIEKRMTAAVSLVAPKVAKGMARANTGMALLSCVWSICAKFLRGEATLRSSVGEAVRTAGAFALGEALALLGMVFGPIGGLVGGVLGGMIGGACGDRIANRAGLA